MNAPAIDTGEGEHIVAARAILAADRALTGGETQRFRDALWRYQDAGDRISLGTLRAILGEIERRADHRMRTAIADRAVTAAEQIGAQRQARPDRWAKLPLVAKACYFAAADREIDHTLRTAFLRLAAIAADERLEAFGIPSTFESQQ